MLSWRNPETSVTLDTSKATIPAFSSTNPLFLPFNILLPLDILQNILKNVLKAHSPSINEEIELPKTLKLCLYIFRRKIKIPQQDNIFNFLMI